MSSADAPADPPQARWAQLTRAERNAAYNNAAAVPDSAAWAEAREGTAAAFRASRAALLDHPYGAKPRQKVDFYLGEADQPCLVFIHGGYWQRNSREGFAHYAEGLLAHGWSVALPGYTLAPEARICAMVAEVGAALDLIATERAARGMAGPLILCGWSAGAQLAVMNLNHPSVAAGLAISGVYDLAPVRDTQFNKALRLSDTDVATLSPLHLPPSPKPVTIAYGTAELPALRYDSQRLAAWRAATGGPGALSPITGADHYSILDELRRPDGALTRAARELAAAQAPSS